MPALAPRFQVEDVRLAALLAAVAISFLDMPQEIEPDGQQFVIGGKGQVIRVDSFERFWIDLEKLAPLFARGCIPKAKLVKPRALNALAENHYERSPIRGMA